jgi:hypothetical protein
VTENAVDSKFINQIISRNNYKKQERQAECCSVVSKVAGSKPDEAN